MNGSFTHPHATPESNEEEDFPIITCDAGLVFGDHYL